MQGSGNKNVSLRARLKAYGIYAMRKKAENEWASTLGTIFYLDFVRRDPAAHKVTCTTNSDDSATYTLRNRG